MPFTLLASHCTGKGRMSSCRDEVWISLMCLEECSAAATWQVAPGREFKHLCPRREFRLLCEKWAKCKHLKVQLHQDCRLLPSASSSLENKETLLCCTDGAKRYKGNRCRTRYLFKHFHTCLFLSHSASF